MLALFLLLAVFSTNDLPDVQALEQVDLSKFNFLNASSGWILLDQHLFWTSDAGQTWREISPAIPTDATIQDVKFIDSNHGWVLWTTSNSDGSLNFQLARTADNSKTWTMSSLPLFQAGEIASFADKAEMGWLDPQTGWISVKQSSGSNFSIGSLFTTSDGGVSWNRFALPIADKIYFSDPQNGWAIGGPSGGQIFATSDGGATWTQLILSTILNDLRTTVYPPFTFNEQGLLVATSFGSENNLNVYSLGKSEQWSSIAQVKLDTQPGQLGLSILDSQNFVATIPGTLSIVRMENGKLNVLKNEDGLSAPIVSLDMISLEDGWAKSIDSNCITASLLDRESASVSCSSTTQLLRTDNGGVTWQVVHLPNVPSGVASLNSGNVTTSSFITALGNTALFVGQGFDRCEIPTLSQMQAWSVGSPYKAVNLYIGGSSRACNNTALISAYLFLLHQHGWGFIPTWVGPQAPCTGFGSRMSSDVNTAYIQGINEANLAVDRLAQLGLTGPDKTGSVIYYDIENYGTNTACRSAVNSFMNGWVSQIHTRGNTAGVYGSTLCNTGLSDFLNIANVPDAMWAARWYHNLGQGYYDPNASVWNLGSCIPNAAWADHQRIRQYEGDHNETWGNLTLEIDSDVLDGVVAIPYDYPYVSGITRKDANPSRASLVNFTVNFSKSVTGVNAADFRLSTIGVTGASISSVSGSGTTYTVTVNTGQSDGTIRLDVADNDSVKDVANNSLGGAGTGNGNFNSGEIYTITKSVSVSGNAGAAGVTLGYAVDGTTKTVTSQQNGDYSLTIPLNWIGTITPSNSCYAFNPTNRSYSNVTSAQTGQDFVPTLNPSSGCADVSVSIGGTNRGRYGLASTQTLSDQYSNLFNGPVKVTSSGGQSIFVTERTTYGNSFHETTGIPNNQLTTDYWFPWYDFKIMQTWISVGNPSSSQTANVSIYIGGQFMGSSTVSPQGRWTPNYPNMFDGPVAVRSTASLETAGGQSNTPGIPIVVSERTLYGQNFNETNGIPNNRLASEYWFPWYDYSIMQTWISVGNPNPSQAANVSIYIAGEFKESMSVPPSGQWTPNYPGVFNGPVQVKSTATLETAGGQSNTPGIQIIATERTLNGESFNETPGIRLEDLTTHYWLPTYDSANPMQTWISVGNPSASQSANVSVYIAGQFKESHSIPPSGRWTPIYSSTLGGPLEVKSTSVLESAVNPSNTPGIPIFFSARTLRGNSFSETNGIPANQLDSVYWFPWYDYQIMQTWLHVGKP